MNLVLASKPFQRVYFSDNPVSIMTPSKAISSLHAAYLSRQPQAGVRERPKEKKKEKK